MLAVTRGLSPDALAALADLERRTVEADGGRLKLEWGVLRDRAARAAARSTGGGSVGADATVAAEVRGGDDVGAEVLWWDAERLVGFAGLYAFGGGLEIAGTVDPGFRRRGIAGTLLRAALPLGRDLGYPTALLVTPRAAPAGAAFARSRGAVLEHSEHALVLSGAPADGPTDPRVTVRDAGTPDVAELTRLLTVAFGWPPGDVADQLSVGSTRTLVIEVTPSGSTAGPAETVPVGTMRVNRDGDTAAVYGFAVDPAWQGRGIGRDALRRVCRRLRTEGACRVALEVAVDNEHALGLYTSLGFTRVITEDYYALPTAAPTA